MLRLDGEMLQTDKITTESKKLEADLDMRQVSNMYERQMLGLIKMVHKYLLAKIGSIHM
jgi:hypothetical protein